MPRAVILHQPSRFLWAARKRYNRSSSGLAAAICARALRLLCAEEVALAFWRRSVQEFGLAAMSRFDGVTHTILLCKDVRARTAKRPVLQAETWVAGTALAVLCRSRKRLGMQNRH